MPEYIDRDIAVKAVMAAKWESGSDGAVAMEIVAASPAVDVEPVRHGRWEYVGENSTGKIFRCSACKFPHNPNKRDIGLIRVDEKPNYCPNCGAKMDGEVEA